MASGYLFLDNWFPRLRIQVPRPDQHCVFIRDIGREIILTNLKEQRLRLGDGDRSEVVRK